jgi:hypothetical protein
MDEVEGYRAAILPAKKDVFPPDRMFAAQAHDHILQELDPCRVVVQVECPPQLRPIPIADQSRVLPFGVVNGNAHHLLRRAGLLEDLFDCGIRALEYAVHGTTSSVLFEAA